MGKQTNRIDEKYKRNMVDKIMCKKNYSCFKMGETYDYWYNFNGLNHIVRYNNDLLIAFSGPIFDPITFKLPYGDDRPWLYDYFYTKEEMRDMKINTIFA